MGSNRTPIQVLSRYRASSTPKPLDPVISSTSPLVFPCLRASKLLQHLKRCCRRCCNFNHVVPVANEAVTDEISEGSWPSSRAFSLFLLRSEILSYFFNLYLTILKTIFREWHSGLRGAVALTMMGSILVAVWVLLPHANMFASNGYSHGYTDWVLV